MKCPVPRACGPDGSWALLPGGIPEVILLLGGMGLGACAGNGGMAEWGCGMGCWICGGGC